MNDIPKNLNFDGKTNFIIVIVEMGARVISTLSFGYRA